MVIISVHIGIPAGLGEGLFYKVGGNAAGRNIVAIVQNDDFVEVMVRNHDGTEHIWKQITNSMPMIFTYDLPKTTAKRPDSDTSGASTGHNN